MNTKRLTLTLFVRPLTPVTCAFVITACGNHAPADTKESLARNPERLQVVLRACRDDPKLFDDPLCHAAADAYRQRFFDRQSIEPKSVVPDAATAKAAANSAPDPQLAAPKFAAPKF